MSLKRRISVVENFSMASMTDVIFLLLIFFLVTSTIIVPNAIKVSLPTASAQPASEQTSVRITITPEGEYYLGLGKAPEVNLSLVDVETQLAVWAVDNPEAYIAIHADESVPYRSVVACINAGSKAGLRIVLATKVAPDTQTAP